MSVHIIDPEQDPRWAALVARHPRASVFHSTGWLEALRRTYGYRPLAVTTSPPGAAELACGVVGCEVPGWFSRRFVSLPFSDHCEPLVDEFADLDEMTMFLKQQVESRTWAGAELRPHLTGAEIARTAAAFSPAQRYYLHALDLSPSIIELHSGLHRSCMQRAIRRAEREQITCEAGSSDLLVKTFYRLLRLTRRRHGMPPQPLSWFRNLAACLGDSLTIRIAKQGGTPVAGLLTLSFKNSVIYKYGGSDARFNKFGAMPFLFWQTIRDAKQRGVSALDLGRSDIDQPSLVAFKERLGARCCGLEYYRYPAASRVQAGWSERAARVVFAHMPAPALSVAGRLLYKHLG